MAGNSVVFMSDFDKKTSGNEDAVQMNLCSHVAGPFIILRYCTFLRYCNFVGCRANPHTCNLTHDVMTNTLVD